MPVCKVCGKFIKSLGYARHRTMHIECAEKAAELANQHTTHDTGEPSEICPHCVLHPGKWYFDASGEWGKCPYCKGSCKLPVS